MRAASRGEMLKNLASNWSTCSRNPPLRPTLPGSGVQRSARNVADGVAAFGEQLPECRRAVGSGEPAADADDGDRLVGAHRPCVGVGRLRAAVAAASSVKWAQSASMVGCS